MSFLFFVKPSIINVDCLTTNVMAYEMAKIEPAIKFVPSWWKNLPPNNPGMWGDHPHIRESTLKRCNGFVDLYKSGFILPMWCDLAIDIGPVGSNYYRYQYSDFSSVAEAHPEEQRNMFCKQENYQHLKLLSPWYVTCKENINWIFMDVVWNDTQLNNYRVLTGVLNFKFLNGTHINIIFKRENLETQILIPYKTPLAQIVPLTEKTVKIKHHLVDQNELEKKTSIRKLCVKFDNRLQAVKKQMQCPIKHN